MKLGIALLGVLSLNECPNYNITGFEIDKQNDNITIFDQDSVRHTYRILDLDDDNFCLDHNEWENVTKKQIKEQ